MSRPVVAACFAGMLLWAGSAQAILRETHSTTDTGEQIPSKTIKLDQGSDTPPAELKKKKEVKTPPRSSDRPPQQATKKPGKDEQNEGASSADVGRAVGTMIGIGVGIGLGMGHGRGDDDNAGRVGRDR